MEIDQSNYSKKDLVTLIATIAFIVAFLVGLKIYDKKTSIIEKTGTKVYKNLVN